MTIESFSDYVSEKVAYYVYRLIDPRNSETFYIGKGKGNRVFSHVNGALNAAEMESDQDDVSEKLGRIRSIHRDGLDVMHVIHRHGLDERTALEIEAALIDGTPGLSNLSGGHGSGDRGPMRAEQIVRLYEAPIAKFPDKVLLINVNLSQEERSLYHAVRYAWRLSPQRASEADYVLATFRGMIIGAFVAEEWLEATEENFPDFPPVDSRWGFRGHLAPPEIQNRYVNKRVPPEYSKRGASNPVKYSF